MSSDIETRNRISSKVLLIDDNENEAKNAIAFLTKAAPSRDLEYIILNPNELNDVAVYLNIIKSLPASAILIDHRLGESAITPFTGLSLASSLRALQPMLPIFILTKWNDDSLEEYGYEVDDVMNKNILSAHAATYVGRLLRAMNRYEDARSAQSKRMQSLIATSLKRELSKEETVELMHIRADIGIESLGREIEVAEKARIRLENKRDLLDALKRMVDEEDR